MESSFNEHHKAALSAPKSPKFKFIFSKHQHTLPFPDVCSKNCYTVVTRKWVLDFFSLNYKVTPNVFWWAC